MEIGANTMGVDNAMGVANVQLLSTTEVATFVARGFLSFPALIDDDVNLAAVAELEQTLSTWGSSDRPFAPNSGESIDEIYLEPSALGTMLRHPVVAGAIESLVGSGAVFDHDFVHLRPPRDPTSQRLHADAVIDPNTAFDIQIFYFPHEIATDGGGHRRWWHRFRAGDPSASGP